MPLYDIAALAHAVDLHPKQLDNLLSRNVLPGIEKKRRGLARRFPRETAIVVKLAADLATAFNLPIGKVLAMAHEIERADRRLVPIGRFATLELDLAALRESTSARLDEAVEVIGRRPRGRRPTVRHT